MNIRIKRVYEPYDAQEGRRILVDRLWPRGLTKEKAHIDAWLKDIAPSQELRQWFNHDPDKWPEFQKRYTAELKANQAAINRLQDELKHGPVTLVYGAKDETHNDAVVLKNFLENN